MIATATVRLEREIATLASRVHRSAPLSPLDVACLAGFASLDPWQVETLATTRNTLMLCGRQTGKSTTVALMALHQAVTHPGTTTVITAPSLRQSQLLYAKVRVFHAALGAMAPAMVEASALRFTLATGSQVIAVPGDGRTIRGYTAHLVIEDESALVSDDTHAAVVPMVATTEGPVVLLSTPHGRRGHFFALWESGDPAWNRTTIRCDQVSRISAAWLAQQRRNLPSYQFRQEFLCEFVQADDAYFNADSIARAFVTGPTLFPIGETADVA